jgi:hypothetical protein
MAKPLIIDGGLYTNVAQRLAREMEVAYFSLWASAAPISAEVMPGAGIPNVERVNDPLKFAMEGKASAVVVTDLYLDDYEAALRSMEIPVIGANSGTVLETDRLALKQLLMEHDLPVADTYTAEGLEVAREHIEKHRDWFVKISTFRGDMETKKGEDFLAEYDELKADLGPTGDSIQLILEAPIESDYEVGLDTWYWGKWLMPAIWGLENKDKAYAGALIEEIPAEVAPIFKVLAAFFSKHEYRGFFSNEMRFSKSGIHMTDATCRVPSPPGGVMMAACRNFADVILKGAAPDYGGARFFCEIILKSQWVAEHFLKVGFAKEMAQRLSFHNHCMIDGDTWIIPHRWGHQEFGSALGWGKTAKEAGEMAKETAKAVEGCQLEFSEEALDEAMEKL